MADIKDWDTATREKNGNIEVSDKDRDIGVNDEDRDIGASDEDGDIAVSDKDGDIAPSDKDGDSLMSDTTDTSSSRQEIELIQRPSTAVPGECALRESVESVDNNA